MIQNEPRVGVGAMIMQEGEVLLVLRKKKSRERSLEFTWWKS